MGAPSLARAETERAAHVVGLFVDQPAVLLSRDRALVTSMPDGAVSVCAYASGVCRPIRAARPCASECNGGVVIELDGAAHDVSDFPSDRDGIARESQSIATDERVRALYGHLRQPPAPTPPPSFYIAEDEWRFEGAIGGGVALRPELSVAVGSIFASLGWGTGVDWDGEDVLHALFGNVIGADLRLRVLPSVLGTSFEQLSVQVGIGPRALWAPRREPFRIGAGYFSILPEIGVITRPDRDASFYFGWTYPVSFAFDAHVGAEVRAWAYLVDDWVEGDDVGWLVGVDAALLVF